MPVTIGETLVEVVASPPVTEKAAPPATTADQERQRLQALLKRLARDRARVRAEGFDD